MFAEIESIFHRHRRRFSRSEWAVRHLGFSTSERTAEEPGLLLIQIDGLARAQVEKAMAARRMPFLKRLLTRCEYSMRTFYPGLPSTTPAVQAELYYGVRAGVPAFAFLDRETGEMGSMFSSSRVKRFEMKFAQQGAGLLEGGSSWSNIYRGGASEDESHFCMAAISWRDIWRGAHLAKLGLFLLIELPAMIRIAGLVLLESFLGLIDALRGILRGEWITQELGMMLSRMCVGIGVRELVTIGAKVDLARGLPIIHVNFVGYDELSHRRGPGSGFAHWSLKGIDGAIRNLYRAAGRSQRRDYRVWIFSDHGQESTRSFAEEVPGGIEKILEKCLAADDENGEPAFQVAAGGPVGHVYFKSAPGEEELRVAARKLIETGGVPGVLYRRGDGQVIWEHRRGAARVPGEAAELFSTHPESLRAELAQDLAKLAGNADAGDLILLGWGPDGESWTFPAEKGAHAGPGPDETQGFLLLPPETRLPAGAGDFVRPDALRAAALHELDRERMPASGGARAECHLRVMSYNVHSCRGMDGRVSPRRIARIVAQQRPDLVALQELDHGRGRSRGEYQAEDIARKAGYEFVFHAAVSMGAEHYGHAVLSRWPIEVVRNGPLPAVVKGWWPEARGALWTRIRVNDRLVNVLTTHLGLSALERERQIEAILGDEWLGPIMDSEPVILCGDFNFPPLSRPYRRVLEHLHDVAPGRGLPTFSSLKPLARLDHIFASGHWVTEQVRVVRNDLTRVASDHLPLIADLMLSPEKKPDQSLASAAVSLQAPLS